MENVKYECLIPGKIKKCKLSGQDIGKLRDKLKVFFDKAVVETQVHTLPKTNKGTVKYEVLDLKLGANIQNILAEACGGSVDDIENICFDTLETVLKFVVCNRELLSEGGDTDLFVFGNKKLFFIARVHKTIEGISVYVGLSNFDLPYSVGYKHKLFTCLK